MDANPVYMPPPATGGALPYPNPPAAGYAGVRQPTDGIPAPVAATDTADIMAMFAAGTITRQEAMQMIAAGKGGWQPPAPAGGNPQTAYGTAAGQETGRIYPQQTVSPYGTAPVAFPPAEPSGIGAVPAAGVTPATGGEDPGHAEPERETADPGSRPEAVAEDGGAPGREPRKAIPWVLAAIPFACAAIALAIQGAYPVYRVAIAAIGIIAGTAGAIAAGRTGAWKLPPIAGAVLDAGVCALAVLALMSAGGQGPLHTAETEPLTPAAAIERAAGDDGELPIGRSAVIDTVWKELEITVGKVDTEEGTYDGSPLSSIEVTYRNISESDPATPSLYDWKAVTRSGEVLENTFDNTVLQGHKDDVLPQSSLAAGKTATGKVFFKTDSIAEIRYYDTADSDEPAAVWRV